MDLTSVVIMQPLIKYYNLESGSEEKAYGLERNLEEFFLEKYISLHKKKTRTILEDISGLPFEEGFSPSSDEEVVDAYFSDALLSVLYGRSRKISPWWNVFRKQFNTQVVLKAPSDIDVEPYFRDSGFIIRHVRPVTHAQYNVLTVPLKRKVLRHVDVLKCFEEYKKANKGKSGANALYFVNQDNTYYGIVDGPVESVLAFRNRFKLQVDVPLQKDEVIFR